MITSDVIILEIFSNSKNMNAKTLDKICKNNSRYLEALNNYFGDTLKQKLFNAYNCIIENPKCECGKNLNFYRLRYRSYCSQKCMSNSNLVREKTKLTSIEKYGTENPYQNKAIQTKAKNTNKRKYNAENVFSSSIIKDKIKQTSIKRYGTENPSQSEVIKSKIKQTFILRYGFENPSYVKVFKDKIRLSHETSGNWMTEDKIKDFEDYKKLVWRYTRQNDLSILENIENRSREGYHLDHKYSIFQGFKDEISAEIIGNICNLEMLPSGQNLSKNRKCSISKDNLLSNFKL